jgi:hypothetical protein
MSITDGHGAKCGFVDYRRLVDWKDGGEFERLHGKPALIRYRYGEGLVPVPDGGSIELACMSEDEKGAFFDYARDCGMWDWTKAEECHCDRACIGELSGTRRLGGVHRRHPERDGDRESFVRQGLESVTGTEESVS